MKKLAVEALIHKYKAECLDAKYVFSNYFNNPVAVGEHPNLLQEMDIALSKYAAAQEKLAAIVDLTEELDYGIEEEPTLFEGMD